MVYCTTNYPEKKAKVLELLTQEGLVGTNENSSPNSPLKRSKFNSPLKKLHEMISSSPRPRTKKIESPSALGRRRALQRLDSSLDEASHERSSPGKTIGRPSNVPQVPDKEILKNLIIYCDVRSNGEDRSSSIKTMVKALGGTVRDKITRDVTHVIFKEGLYSTFRKAQNMKMHIVSVLWLDAVRRYKCKMPEEKYKPMDFDKYNNMDELQVCQEIENEFNDVLSDEIRRSAEKQPQFQSHFNRSNLSTNSFSNNDILEDNNVVNGDDEDLTNRPGFVTPSNPSSTSSRSSKCSTPPIAKTNLNTSKNNNNNKDKDLLVVPCSQNDSHSFTHARKSMNLSRVVEETFENEPELEAEVDAEETNAKRTNLSKHVRDSFELKKVQRLKSPPHEIDAAAEKSIQSRRSSNKISISDEESMHLHVTTTTDQSLNNTRRRSTASSNFAQKLLTSDLPATNNNTARTSKSSTDLLNESKNRRRTTIGLSRSKKSSTTNLENLNEKTTNLLNNVENLITNETTVNNAINTTSKKGRARKLFKGDHVDESLFNWDKAAELPQITPEPCTTPPKKRKVEMPHDFPKVLSSRARKKVSTVKKSTAKKQNNIITNNINNNNNISAKQTLAKVLQFGEKEQGVSTANNNVTTTATNSKNKTTSIAGIQEIDNEEHSKEKPKENEKSVKPKRSYKKTIEPSSTEEGREQPTITAKRPKRKSVAPVNYKKLASLSSDNDSDDNEPPSKKKPDRGSNMTNGEKTDESYKTAYSDLSSTEKPKTRKSKRFTLSSISSGEDSDDENVPKSNKRKSRHTISSISSENSDDIPCPKAPKSSPARSTRKSTIKNSPISKVKATPVRSTRRASVMKEINLPETPNIRKNAPKTPQTKNKAQNAEKTPSRRSTLEFLPRSSRKSLARIKAATAAAESPKPVTVKLPSIVCTRFHRDGSQVFQQIVDKLGGFVVEDEVTKRTTHLVCHDTNRTVNLMRAIARGCWILRKEWLYKSMEEERWLEEEDYEMVEFSPAIQKCRLERQAFGPLFSMDIFKDCGTIFISRGSIPRCSDLEELVQLCGGRIVRIIRDADIIVGESSRSDNNNSVSVTEKWILDSITDNKKKNVKNYEILDTGHT